MNVTDLLIRHEGIRLKAYMDTKGKTSVGVGRNLDDNGITRDEALYLLQNDITKCDHDLRMSFAWFGKLSEPRQAVVLSMTFNMGLGGLMEFRQMLAALALGDFNHAADQMLSSHWASQVGKRAVELAQMMRADQFITG